MNDERVEAIFIRACDVSRADRQAVVDEACGDDRDLKHRVEQLLAHDVGPVASQPEIEIVGEGVTGFLDSMAESSGHDVPESIGPYRIRRRIGAGGMGYVYEAEQREPRRRVAIKVLPGAMWSPATRARFQREADALGRLNHRGIAQIYGSGEEASAQRTPYFAMEYVDGQRLTEATSQRGLDLDARVALMAAIADAVHHAHQRGVIHRDLKPGNILVDEGGDPKVVDFGISLSTDDQDDRITESAAGSPGTPCYMSPEQLGTVDHPVTTAVDQHALGVVAYELFTGARPYNVKTYGEAARTIGRIPVPRLCRADRRLRGDLDTIVGRAMAVQPEDRYDSVAAFGTDLRRWRAKEPVMARRPTLAYLVSSLVRRHRVASSVLIVLLLIGLAMITSIVALSRERAAEANRRGAAVKVFSDVLGFASPRSYPETGYSIDEALLRAADDVDREAVSLGPDSMTFVNAVLGRLLIERGRFTAGAERIQRVLGSPEANDLFDVEELYDLRVLLIEAAIGLDRPEDVLAELDEIADHSEALPPARTQQADAMRAQALFQLQEYDAAIDLLGPIVERARSHPSGVSIEMMARMVDLGGIMTDARRFEDARAPLTTARDWLVEHAGPLHPETGRAHFNLGGLEAGDRKWAKARAEYEKALTCFDAVYGAGAPFTAFVRSRWAEMLFAAGEGDRSRAELTRAVDDLESELGGSHDWTHRARSSLMSLLERQERYDEATDVALRLVRDLPSNRKPSALTYTGTLSRAGKMAHLAGRYEEAIDLNRELLRIADTHDHDPGWRRTAIYRIGLALARLERDTEALEELEEALRLNIEANEENERGRRKNIRKAIEDVRTRMGLDEPIAEPGHE